MTQEDKELLLIDLCARLLYGVIVDYRENEFEIPHWKITTIHPDTMDGWIGYNKRIGSGSESGSRHFNIGEVKPYLRPMSSMTEEELIEYKHLVAFSGNPEGSANFVDWLNKKMFAYRTINGKDMFELGLALVAPEGMYDLKEE